MFWCIFRYVWITEFVMKWTGVLHLHLSTPEQKLNAFCCWLKLLLIHGNESSLEWAERLLTKEAISPQAAIFYVKCTSVETFWGRSLSAHQLEDEAWVKMDNPTIQQSQCFGGALNPTAEWWSSLKRPSRYSTDISPFRGNRFSERLSEGTEIVLVCFFRGLEEDMVEEKWCQHLIWHSLIGQTMRTWNLWTHGRLPGRKVNVYNDSCTHILKMTFVTCSHYVFTCLKKAVKLISLHI